MMKKILIFLLASVIASAFQIVCFAENANDDYGEAVGEELFSSFDKETKKVLELFGIDGIESAGAFDFSSESLSRYFKINLKEKLLSAVKMFFEFISLLMIASLSKLLVLKEKSEDAFSMMSVCVFSLVAAKKTYDILNVAVTAVGSVGKITAAFVPVYAGIVAVSGSPASAGVYNTLTLFLAEGVSYLFTKAVVPFSGAVLCLSIAFSMSKVVNCNRFLSAAGKISSIGLGFFSALFTGFLSFRGVLASAADSAGTKGIRFLVSNLIPVVGSAMSDAYSAFYSSINLIKGSVAVVGICAVFFCCFPAVAELLSYYILLSALSFAAEVIGENNVSSLFKGFSLAVKVLLLVLVYELFIVIISTGLMLYAKGGT